MNAPARRGACPRLYAPMATGDGLLARLIPSGATIVLDGFVGLCSAARSCGNGIIEITSRGSIQVRGLSAGSTSSFAAAVDSLGIDCGDGIPVLTNPLSGLDPDETFDVGANAATLRHALAAEPFASRLAAKVSVVMDGGGTLHLDEVASDIRLRAADARDGRFFHVSLGGDASTAVPLGAVTPDRVVECVIQLLRTLAGMAAHARIRNVLLDDGLSAFVNAVSDLMVAMPQPAVRRPGQPIGIHGLRAGNVAIGVGLPFGHSEAETLKDLSEAGKRAGGSGVRTAPDRALLLLGLSFGAAQDLLAQAGALGFIVDPADPRRKVIACAGAPVCASGLIPSRSVALKIAQAEKAMLNVHGIIHISGCSKGCAHPAPAPIAAFGRDQVCDILVDGRLSCSVTVENLPAKIVNIVQSRMESKRG